MVCGTGGWTGPLPGDPDSNILLWATPAFGGIDVGWTYPETFPEAVAHVILYRSTSSNVNTAVRLNIVNGTFYYDKSTTTAPVEFFYWIQIVSVHGTVSDMIGPASATAKPTIEDMMELLTAKIDEGLLATALRTQIDQIALNLDIIQAETAERINADALLGNAYNLVQAHADETRTLLSTEVTNRTEADEAIIEAVNTYYAFSQGTQALLVEEQNVRASADAALSQQITSLVADVGEVTAALQQESTTRANQDEAFAQQLTELESSIGDDGIDPAITWQFDTTAEGWTGSGATLTPAAGGKLTYTATVADSFMLSPGINVSGALFTEVRARITRVSGTGWDGRLYYQTSGHGFTVDYYKLPINPGLDVGESATVKWNMAALTAGDNDWVSSTIEKLRLDLGSQVGDEFRIDWITVGRVGPAASSYAVQELTTRVTTTEQGLEAVSESYGLLLADVEANTAAIQNEATARADGDQALASQISTVQAEAEAATAAVQDEATARAEADDLLAERLVTVETHTTPANLVENCEFALNTASWTFYTEDNSTFAKCSTPSLILAPGTAEVYQPNNTSGTASVVYQRLWAEPGKIYQISAFTGAQNCMVTVDLVFYDANGQVLSDGPNGVNDAVKPGGNSITDWLRVYANAQAPAGTIYMLVRLIKYGTKPGQTNSKALFTRVLVCEVSATDAPLQAYSRNYAAVQQSMFSVNGWSAGYTLRTDVNGLIGGFGLTNDGQSVEFGVSADTFWVGRTNADKIKPFIVQDGVTYIAEAAIQMLTFTKLRDESGSVMVENGKLKAQYITVGDIQSSNYVANSQGWRLNQDGSFEINGSVAGSGRVHINNDGVYVYDANNVLRVELGKLN